MRNPSQLPLPLSAPGVNSRLQFFRQDEGSLTFVSPFLQVPGITFPSSVRLDVMHIVDLGTCARYVGTVLRRLLDSGRWGPATDAVGRRMRTMGAAIWAYYRACAEPHTRMSKYFPETLLGPRSRPVFKGKAHEARSLLNFCLQELGIDGREDAVRHEALLRAGQKLRVWYDLLAANGRGLADEDSAALLESCCDFVRWWRKARGWCTVKHHYMVHLSEDAAAAGNPRMYHTYADEGFNRVVKRLAVRAHPLNFAGVVLATAKTMQQGRADRPAPR